MSKLKEIAEKFKKPEFVLLFPGAISVLIIGVVFGLDLAIMTDVINRAGIAKIEYDKYFSLLGSTISVSILYIILFIILGWILIGLRSSEKYFFIILIVSSFLVLIPHEAVIFKFNTCINYPTNQLIYARSILSIFLFLIIFLTSVRVYFVFDNKRQKIFSIIALILFFLCAITLIILNIYTLATLKPELKYDVSATRTEIGLFTQDEIDQIEKGTFKEDSSLKNFRFICKLEELLNTETKKVADTSPNGEKTYWFFFDRHVECTKENQVFYKDCLNSSKVSIRIAFLETQKDLPHFNCALNLKKLVHTRVSRVA